MIFHRRGRDFVNPWDTNGPSGGFGGSNFGNSNNAFGNSGFGGGPGGGNNDFGSLDNEGKTSTQVTIPKDVSNT